MRPEDSCNDFSLILPRTGFMVIAMNGEYIISKLNGALYQATIHVSIWMNKILPQITKNWWQECVMDKLSYNQRMIAAEKNITKLEEFDLAALLRIADRNWYVMRDFACLSTKNRDCLRNMMVVRNKWAHCSGALPQIELIKKDVLTIIGFLKQFDGPQNIIIDLETMTENLDKLETEADSLDQTEQERAASLERSEIKEKNIIKLVSQPNVRGVVISVESVGDIQKYNVFVDGSIRTFYAGQIVLAEEQQPTYNWIDLPTLQSYLSAFEINNPSSGKLYSLNAARIDFIPYQFRPALKMIKSDEPRILIADSVGVGKTIEAGLIIKELEARSDLERIMIICPKPLISERKWEIEMKQRFDEDFVPLASADLRQIINDTNRDGEWPARFNKVIVPYSIFDSRVYDGVEDGKVELTGLAHLDPAPHFDLIIVDEAHHIRNGSMVKEKAFAYKATKYFCDNADAVVMLTATPLQTSNDDLFTLLNVLRPDVVTDEAVFTLMSQPNAYISKCASTIRRAEEGWQAQAQEDLNGVLGTQWGESVIGENPLFVSIISRLDQEEISRDERVQLITDVESLHSFNTMINRTRRKDIQDFCIRRTFTLESEFTEQQKMLHDELLNFEQAALATLHDVRSVPFMISTIRRQAASCIFGLAPYIRGIIDKRIAQLADILDVAIDAAVDIDAFEKTPRSTLKALKALASPVLSLADNLPDEDPKLQCMLEIIDEKQSEENNKIIIFSTFRCTLCYIKEKLKALGYRVEQIDGSVKDEHRCAIRNRFELPRDDANALDILLFTEVGSEGLDYQFCNTMINYDLPWNPMRIEQRIGRIDRRGQTSEFVNIYNLITSSTVDADIYNRCLLRIGVFEKSIGECEEILGEIGRQAEHIAMDQQLTDAERKKKLEQMADNEIRRVQELSRLEDEEKALFGFDLSNNVMAKEIQDAESPWISPKSLLSLVNTYLNARLGIGNYILGDSEVKTLRLSVAARNALRDDFKKLTGTQNAVRKKWDMYLKGTVPTLAITFHQESASKDKNAFFITAMHPLVKQAAMHFATIVPAYISLSYTSDSIPKGEYAFSIYAWNYVGARSRFRLVAVSENDTISDEIFDFLANGTDAPPVKNDFSARWQILEMRQISMWNKERQNFIEDVNLSASYKLASLEGNFKYRKRGLERQISKARDESIIRMKQSELENAKERYAVKVASIKQQIAQSDIHTSLIANGVIHIE